MAKLFPNNIGQFTLSHGINPGINRILDNIVDGLVWSTTLIGENQNLTRNCLQCMSARCTQDSTIPTALNYHFTLNYISLFTTTTTPLFVAFYSISFSDQSATTLSSFQVVMKHTMDSSCSSTSSSLSLSSCKFDEDTLQEIFVRLPIESIFRFSCVSKQCLSFTMDSRFMARKRESFTPLAPWGFFYEYCCGDLKFVAPNVQSRFLQNCDGFNFNFLPSEVCECGYTASFDSSLVECPLKKRDHEYIAVLAASNSLVLCAVVNVYDWEKKTYYICNPLTRKYVTIPEIQFPDKIVIQGLVCESDPCSLAPAVYKVLFVPAFNSGRTFQIEIYYSDLNRWSTYEVTSPEVIVWDGMQCKDIVTHNGISCWIVKGNRIVAYDLNTENHELKDHHQCRLIDLPEISGPNRHFEYFWESDGLLSYCPNHEGVLDKWVLDEEEFKRGSWSWCLVHSSIVSEILLDEDCQNDRVRELFSEGIMVYDLEPLAFIPGEPDTVILGYDAKCLQHLK